MAPAYNDALWAMGAAPLGYTDQHIVTTVSFGLDPNNKYITTWVRTAFKVTGAAMITAAELGLLRDDGAVAYLNGVEIGRSNMPLGAITAATPASASAGGAEETTYFPFPISPARFVEGTNVLAIEVHQQSAGSSDLGVDAMITVELP